MKQHHKHALHDIRLHFKAMGIYELLSRDKTLVPNPQSKDIRLDPYVFEPSEVKYNLTVHHTDTVSVIVASDLRPIAVDIHSIRKLTEDLTRLEERLVQRLRNIAQLDGVPYNVRIPRHVEWIIKMWHFGADGSVEYNGEAFHMTFDDGMNGLERVYVKDMKNGKHILRYELQEYPDKNFEDALEEKLTVD